MNTCQWIGRVCPSSCFDTAYISQSIGNQHLIWGWAMKIHHLVIEEDSLPEKFLELQTNELMQDRLIWQHLTKGKINEMNHIPDEDYADGGDD